MDLAAVVLAGGLGTRLRSVVTDRPKVLAPVAGRPFLTYLLDQISEAGIRRVVLSTGHLAEQFKPVIGQRYRDLKILYAREESPLGTGGAIRFAGGLADADQLLVMNGDSYCDASLSAYIDWHRKGQHDVSLMLATVDDASRYGTVVLDPDGRVTAFCEKSPEGGPGYINAGVYLLRRSMLEQIPAGHSSIERDVFPRWLEQRAIMGWVADGAFIDIGVPSDYERSHEFMKRVGPSSRGRLSEDAADPPSRAPVAAPTVFLDRDGTINREVHHLSDPNQLELLPGAAEGLRELCRAGFPLVVVSNQSPIGRGMFTEDRLREINGRLAEMLAAEGVQIAAWYWCPHAPWEGCSCRKPAPGLFLRAGEERGVILNRSWVIGDRLADLCAGRKVGARTILVATGYGEAEYALPQRPECVDYFVPTLREAADVILRGCLPPSPSGRGPGVREPRQHPRHPHPALSQRERFLLPAFVKVPALSQPDESTLLGFARDHLLASAETKRRYAETSAGDLVTIGRMIAESFAGGGKLLLCGNGGSAADCQHIAAEFTSILTQTFNRRALPAIALTTDTSFLTARGNDYGFDSVFARQVEALGKRGDVLIGISTSGNSKNVLLAFEAARRIGLKTVGLTGGAGGQMLKAVDVCLCVPAERTAHIQECHITMGHIVVSIVEKYLFNSDGSDRAIGESIG